MMLESPLTIFRGWLNNMRVKYFSLKGKRTKTAKYQFTWFSSQKIRKIAKITKKRLYISFQEVVVALPPLQILWRPVLVKIVTGQILYAQPQRFDLFILAWNFNTLPLPAANNSFFLLSLLSFFSKTGVYIYALAEI